MSIQRYREALKDIPGAKSLTMHYEDGGKIEVYSIAGREIRFKGGATMDEVREGFRSDG